MAELRLPGAAQRRGGVQQLQSLLIETAEGIASHFGRAASDEEGAEGRARARSATTRARCGVIEVARAANGGACGLVEFAAGVSRELVEASRGRGVGDDRRRRRCGCLARRRCGAECTTTTAATPRRRVAPGCRRRRACDGAPVNAPKAAAAAALGFERQAVVQRGRWRRG